MNLQISLPRRTPCVFKCPYCVVEEHDKYTGAALAPVEFVKAMNDHIYSGQYDRIIISGENEPMQNKDYLICILADAPKDIIIEVTARGFDFDFLIKNYPQLIKRINVINFSVCNDDKNPTHWYDKQLRWAEHFHSVGVITRFTYMMTKKLSPNQIKEACHLSFIDQITLKEIQGTKPWIKENKSNFVAKVLWNEITDKPYKDVDRFIIFRVHGQTIWVDHNCQDGSGNYLILRPDGEVYEHWEDTIPLLQKKASERNE